MASGPVLHLGMIFSDLPTCDTFAVGSVGCCSWQGEESWQRGACGPSTVQALSRPELGTSVSAPEVSHQWFKPCEFRCSNLNFGSWELLRWERKCAFDYEWKEVPEPSSAIWKNKALIWPFCCTLKWDVGRRRGDESCPPQLLSSGVGATRYCCARRNATTWAWTWPRSVLANCFFSLRRALCGQKHFMSEGRDLRCASLAQRRCGRTGLGFNWHSAKPCLTHIWDCAGPLAITDVLYSLRVVFLVAMLCSFLWIPAGICLMRTELRKLSKSISVH